MKNRKRKSKKKSLNSPPPFTEPNGETSRVDPNCRERWRQQHVNAAFLRLRRILPSYPVDKKLSKQEILRRTIKYIKLLEGVLDYFNGHNSAADDTELAKVTTSRPTCNLGETCEVSAVNVSKHPKGQKANDSVSTSSDSITADNLSDNERDCASEDPE